MNLTDSNIHFNAQLLVQELEKKQWSAKIVGPTPIVELAKGDQVEYLYDVCVSQTSFPAGWIASDKFYTKQMLEHSGLSVMPGKVFFLATAKKEILKYAKKIGFPVVLKPITQGHGAHVFTHIESSLELEEKCTLFESEYVGDGYVLVEKHLFGEEYRLFATASKYVAAVHRIPASVVGDGKQPLILLIQAENYKRMNPRTNCLCEIVLDSVLFDHIEKQGISINDTPKKGERITLRPTSNVSKGGNCHDVTTRVHPSIQKLAVRAIQAIPGLAFAGVDLICQDVTKPLSGQEYAICELNPSPGLSLHMLPEKGRKRNVASVIAKLMENL